MCTTGEAPGSGRERNKEDRPAATGPDEPQAERNPAEFDAGPDVGDDAAASLPRGEESPIEPLIADFPDGAGATGELVGAGAGVVIGAVVTADGVALATCASPTLAVVPFGFAALSAVIDLSAAASRAVFAEFETRSRLAEFTTDAAPASALFGEFEAPAAVAVPFRFGRDGDTEKCLLLAVGSAAGDDASRSRCTAAVVSEFECSGCAAFFAESTAESEAGSSDFAVAGELRASSSLTEAEFPVGASAIT